MKTRNWWIAGAALVVVAALLTWWLWPDQAPPAPRARVYKEFTVCLLTDDRGVTGSEAAPVWAAISEAALAQKVQAQYTRVRGEQTKQQAEGFLNGIAGTPCSIVFAVGTAEVAAVQDRAAAYLDVRFYTFTTVRAMANLSQVEGDARSGITAIISDAGRTAS